MKWSDQLKQMEYVDCGNPACQRTLKREDYDGFYPKPNTPKDHIHRWENRQCYDYSVLCTCGHYTIAVHVGR
jgi:hypothetical protein